MTNQGNNSSNSGSGIKLQAHYETEAYMTAGGYYAIKQENPTGSSCIVLLKPWQLKELIEDMLTSLKDLSLFEADEDDE